MAKLTARARSRIPAKDFALGKGRYPIEDGSHARNALARVSQHGTPAEKATVREKVYEKYPGMGEGGSEMKKEHEEKGEAGKHEGKKEGKKEHEGGEKRKKKAEAKSEGGRNHHGNYTAKQHNAITSH